MACSCTTRRAFLRGSAGLAAGTVLSGCEDNVMGRSALMLFDDDELATRSASYWAQLRAESPVSQNPADLQRVLRVGMDMVEVSGVGGDPEFMVIADDTPNAFVLPGTKVAVHTGLLTLADSDDELAAVLGHEMGHVIAGHANERMSQQSVANLFIGVATDFGQDEVLERQLGLAAQLGILLPYSREHELESDRLGVRYAAAAGYDPRGALSLWDKMAAVGGGQIEFLSTHPVAENRKAVISAEIATL